MLAGAATIREKDRVPRPSILLVTLDTTRADSVGYESAEVETPALDALAARGTRFSQAWTTVPMTLPAHTSMLTGLYPPEHGIRENSRFLDEDHALLAGASSRVRAIPPRRSSPVIR